MVTWTIFSGGDQEWNTLLSTLNHSNIYQTSEWGNYRKNLGWDQLRMVVFADDKAMSAIQLSVRKLPLGLVMLWAPGAGVGNFDNYGQSLISTIKKLFKSKIVYCRLNFLKEINEIDVISLKRFWSTPWVKLSTGHSLIFNTEKNESERVIALSGNWRHNLKRSNKYGLKIMEWIGPNPLEIFSIYQVMEQFKGIGQQYSLTGIERLLVNLGGNLIVYKCLDAADNLIALRGCAFSGIKAWDLFAAATPAARKVYASHALFWALTSKCHELGVISYDMSGADPIRNVGVYNFKRGTGARDIKYLGEWEWSNYPFVKIFINLLIFWKYKSI